MTPDEKAVIRVMVQAFGNDQCNGAITTLSVLAAHFRSTRQPARAVLCQKAANMIAEMM